MSACRVLSVTLRSDQGPAGIVLALVGNKRDLEAQRQVPTREAKAYADSIGAVFAETSAKKDENITALFTQIGALACNSSAVR